MKSLLKVSFVFGIFNITGLTWGLESLKPCKNEAIIFSSALKPKSCHLPVEDFFRAPEKAAYTLSPSGEWLAFLAPWENRLNLFVQKTENTEQAVRITSLTDRSIAHYLWKGDQHLVYMKDNGGDENYHLFVVGIDGKNERELTPFEGVRVAITDELCDNDNELLIEMNRRDRRLFDVYRINLQTGELTCVAENPGNIARWIVDNEGRVRAALAQDGLAVKFLYREKESQPFKEVLSMDFKEAFEPYYFTKDNQALYAISNLNRDKKALVVFDPRTCLEKEIVFEHPEVDVSGFRFSENRKVLIEAIYTTDKTGFFPLDPFFSNLRKQAGEKFPSYGVYFCSNNRKEDRFIVCLRNDRQCGRYYYHDTRTNNWKWLADVKPWLKEEDMASMYPFQIKSRDGLSLHGYLTLPNGYEAKKLPVVVNPHGGPWARDIWGFQSDTQFFANRGYAVLQVNFRGSTGYGKNFWKAGFKEWGKKMQDDITDTVRWFIEQKIADPKRIAIYGFSYGGYATLAGLAFTPELYACGIDGVGPSSLLTLLETIPPYWELGRAEFYEEIGHLEKEKDLLKAASPLFHVDKMQAPLMVIQGANDPRVKKSESDQIVNALRNRSVEVEYVLREDEGHGFSNPENNIDLYKQIEKFLATHLKLNH